jgi:hypothetical protein
LNEPDEDLERNVPEEPLPERDVLLEALVDLETEAKPRRRFSKTLIAACILSGLGVWQIVHVSKGGEPIFQLASKAKTAPSKLRSDRRAPLGRVLPSTDPVAAYLDRAKRGMTDQEIRWMIEDFQTAGLEEEEHSLKGTLRAKQQLWYLEALTEALQLSPEQKAQAKAKMNAMRVAEFELLEKEFEEEAANYPNSHPDVRTALQITYLHMASNYEWLSKDGYAPWKLCDLTKEQSQLTLQKWRSSEEKEIPKAADAEVVDPFVEPVENSWIRQKYLLIQDPASGNLIDLPPLTVDDVLNAGRHQMPDLRISDVFPLTPDQKLADHRNDLLAQARMLHPAQLRMFLLLNSDIADILLREPEEAPILTNPEPVANPGIITDKSEEPTPNTFEPAAELPPNPTEPETPVDPVPEPDPK